jgi:osmotically-inducible protein OsmY
MADPQSNLFRSGFFALSLLAGALVLGGCAGTVATIADDRTGSQKLDDNEIVLSINQRLLSKKYRDLFFKVSSDVFEARVMLSGTVAKEADRQRVLALVKDLPGIRTVYNETQVATSGGFKKATHDAWIDTKLRASLLSAEGVRSVNYRWRVVNGTVYILGRSLTPIEKQRVMKVIKNTERVNNMVDHITVGPNKGK